MSGVHRNRPQKARTQASGSETRIIREIRSASGHRQETDCWVTRTAVASHAITLRAPATSTIGKSALEPWVETDMGGTTGRCGLFRIKGHLELIISPRVRQISRS